MSIAQPENQKLPDLALPLRALFTGYILVVGIGLIMPVVTLVGGWLFYCLCNNAPDFPVSDVANANGLEKQTLNI